MSESYTPYFIESAVDSPNIITKQIYRELYLKKKTIFDLQDFMKFSTSDIGKLRDEADYWLPAIQLQKIAEYLGVSLEDLIKNDFEKSNKS